MVIVTYRDTDLDRTHPLAEMLADLRRHEGVTRIGLTGLDERGVTTFMERTAGHELDEAALELARALHDETEGNPFFVGEVLLHLAESGALVMRDGRWTSDLTLADVGIPEGVREVVGRRLSHLDDATNEVLTVAAVIGREFDVGMLGALVEGGQDAALDAIEAAESSRLVVDGTGAAGSYRFAHALVRSTLYDELATSRRLRLHRDVARAFAARSDVDQRLPELARHFAEAAALGEIDQAVHWGRQAGDAAMRELAWEEAATHYLRALDALELDDDPDPAVRCDLLISAAPAVAASNRQRADTMLDEALGLARRLGDAARFADAGLIRCGNPLEAEAGGVFDEDVVAMLDEAFSMIGDDDRRRARLLSARAGALLWSGDLESRRRHSDEALAIARRLDDRTTLAKVLNERAYIFDSTNPSSMDDYLSAQAEVIELADSIDDRELLCRAHLSRSPGLITIGDRTGGEADLRSAEDLVKVVSLPALEARARTLRTALVLLSGRLAEAEELIEQGEQFALANGVQSSAPAHRYRLLYERGQLGLLEEFFSEMADAQPAVSLWRIALVAIYTTTDRFEEARVHLRRLAADDWAMVPRDGAWIVTIAGSARTAGMLGELDIAASAYKLAVPQSSRIAFTGQSFEHPIALSVGTAAAALGNFDDAERLFEESLALSTRAEAPTFIAATQTQWADMCLDRNADGDADKARALVDASHEASQRLGLDRITVLNERVLGRL
jgi:tetratricopeptide (TPR) repeat protein